MSMICVGVMTCRNTAEHTTIKLRLLRIAQSYNSVINFDINWSEPIMASLPISSCAFSVEDGNGSGNCEMLLLPEGWFVNGKTNNSSTIERMEFIQRIAENVIAEGIPIEFYIGTSGDLPEDYYSQSVDRHQLANFLASHIEKINSMESLHIIVR